MLNDMGQYQLVNFLYNTLNQLGQVWNNTRWKLICLLVRMQLSTRSNNGYNNNNNNY